MALLSTRGSPDEGTRSCTRVRQEFHFGSPSLRLLFLIGSFRGFGSRRLRPKLFRPCGKCCQGRFPQGQSLAHCHHLDVALFVLGKANLKQIPYGLGCFVFHFCFYASLESMSWRNILRKQLIPRDLYVSI